MNPEALPIHFNLYNISQLVVMTKKAKKALSTSPWFEKEATFGKITLYRYTACDGRYVDVPKVRPVLYTGKKWTDEFFSWYKNINRINTLFVPDRFVKDDKDRAVFLERTDSVIDFDPFYSENLDRTELKIATHLDHLKIRFTTNKIGLPHLIKVSYFPNWKVQGANGVYPVSPHLMLVIPREEEVTLTYERSHWEIIGLWITGGLFVLLIIKGILSLKGTSIRFDSSYYRKACKRWKRIWESFELGVDRARPLLFSLVIISVSCCIIAGAIFRNIPVRKYIAGLREYKRGSVYYHKGKDKHTAKHFKRAIQIMDPLLRNRSRYDHRDVINSILLTAKCHEKMAEYDRAEALYRTLLREYPYSRYVAEGYVKIALIYKQREELIWKDGLKKLKDGDHIVGTQLLFDGLSLAEKSIEHYIQALENDAYSPWADRSRQGLNDAKKYLDRLEEDLSFMGLDNEINSFISSLKLRLGKIILENF
jgi:tetratricopeptide (TPR) repeat protein